MTASNVHEHVQVVAVRHAACSGSEEIGHVVAVKLRDDTVEDAATVMEKMDSGERVYSMVPPPGAPAYDTHAKAGLQLILQTRECPECGERVLFA